MRLIGDLLSFLPLPQLIDLHDTPGDSSDRAVSVTSAKLVQVIELYLDQVGRAALAAVSGGSTTSLLSSVASVQQQQQHQRFIPEVPLIKASTFDEEWRSCLDGIMMLANMTSFIKQLCLPAEAQASMAAAIMSANATQSILMTSNSFQPLFMLTRSSSGDLMSPLTVGSSSNGHFAGFRRTKVSLYDIIGLFMLLSNHLCNRTNDVIVYNKKMRTLSSSTADARDVRFAIDSAALDAAASTSTLNNAQMYALLLRRHVINLLVYCEKIAYSVEALLAIICSHLDYFVELYMQEQRKAARFAREHAGKTLRPLFMEVNNDEFDLLERLQADVRGDLGVKLTEYMIELSKTILSKSSMLDIYRTKVELLKTQLEEFDKQNRKLEQQWLQQQQQQRSQSPRVLGNSFQSPRVGGGDLPTDVFKRGLAQQQQGSPFGSAQSSRRVLQFR